jgi:hypothetical protein
MIASLQSVDQLQKLLFAVEFSPLQVQ